MQITPRSRFLLRLQAWVFVALFTAIIGLLAWLSTLYVYQADWTAGGRNTISEDTRKLLAEMTEPVTITAYAREDELLRKQIKYFVGKYQRFKPDITLEFVNPDTAPERVRTEGVTVDGELVVGYRGRNEHVQALSEQTLTNALLRLTRQDERWIVFLTGHGERDPHGEANADLGAFGKELERNGLKVQEVNLAENAIPSNTSLLVIAGPRVNLLPGEVTMVRDYVTAGGNLLWLAEPGKPAGLETLADQLGIAFLPGVIVDATTQSFGINDPSFALVTAYPNHEVTREFKPVTVFPEAAALDIREDPHWQATPILSTLSRSWTELGELKGEIQFDENTDERAGPLDIGVALTAIQTGEMAADTSGTPPHEQRIIVIGDGDFLSNTYLGNVGNLGLGLNMVHWLSHDDAFIDIHVKAAPDTTLELNPITQGVIGLGSLIGLPILLMTSGLVIWLRRRRR
jgi:gliding motility-associatede transport system auxiliary component